MILDEIVQNKEIRLREQKKIITLEEMRTLAQQADKKQHSFYEALKNREFPLLESLKASPSLGSITSKISLEKRLEAYNQAVDAISCLTEADHFHGDIKDLQEIRKQSSLPILRKDFMIDEYQFYEEGDWCRCSTADSGNPGRFKTKCFL